MGIVGSATRFLPRDLRSAPTAGRDDSVVTFRPARILAAGAVGWTLGNLPSAALAGRVAGVDPAAAGTGNPGAMNTGHVLGRGWGAAVSVADIAKGTVAARIGNRLAGATGANLAAAAAVTGHCHPFGRVGGKGVATSIGQVLGTFPVYFPIDIGVAAATATLPHFRQRTRLATSVASVTWVGCAALWWRRQWDNPGGVVPTAALPLAAAASSMVIATRFAAEAHRVDAFNAATNAAWSAS